MVITHNVYQSRHNRTRRHSTLFSRRFTKIFFVYGHYYYYYYAGKFNSNNRNVKKYIYIYYMKQKFIFNKNTTHRVCNVRNEVFVKIINDWKWFQLKSLTCRETFWRRSRFQSSINDGYTTNPLYSAVFLTKINTEFSRGVFLP